MKKDRKIKNIRREIEYLSRVYSPELKKVKYLKKELDKLMHNDCAKRPLKREKCTKI